MADYLRLRQICLAAPRLAPVVADLEEIFGIRVCYRDGNVAKYGLENALFMVGTNFLEIVAPTQDEHGRRALHRDAQKAMAATWRSSRRTTCAAARSMRKAWASASRM